MEGSEGNEKLFEVRDVSIAYRGKDVLWNIDFSVFRGDNLCIVGPNGAGKSTLLMGILGLVKLNGGSVHFISDKTRISYLPQISTVERDFPTTVWEIVLSGTQSQGKLPFYTRADRQNAMKAVSLLKIEDLLKKRIGNLSGGQAQRVFLARAISRSPELLILDEPCSALDPDITLEMYDLFDQLKSSLALTFVISTHDHAYAIRSATKVLELNGTMTYFGPPDGWPGNPERSA